MKTSRIFKSVMVGAMVFLSGQALADVPTHFSEMNLCVGDSETVRAPKGAVYTYTEAKFDTGIPSMNDESSRAAYFGPATSDEEGTPSWMELRPNDTYLGDADMDMLHHPHHYMEHIASSNRSRIVVQARSEGAMTIEFFEIDMDSKESLHHILKVNVAQCGSSTAVKAAEKNHFCRGQVKYKGGAIAVARGQESLFLFKGALSGNQFLTGSAVGRALVRTFSKSEGVVYTKTNVYPEGKGGCGFTDATRLEALEGENAYVLQLCKGDTWIVPTKRTIENMEYTGQAVRGETSVRNNGFAITGIYEGLSMVTVDFNHADAAPMDIYTEVIECN